MQCCAVKKKGKKMEERDGERNQRKKRQCPVQSVEGIYRKRKSQSEVAQSYLTLSDPMDCSHQAPPSMGFSRRGSESLVSATLRTSDSVRTELPAAPSPSSVSSEYWPSAALSSCCLLPPHPPPVSTLLLPGWQTPSPRDSLGIHISRHTVPCVCSQHTWVQNEENCMN